MNSKNIIIIIIFLISVFSVAAEFDVAGAYTYLISKSINGSYGNIIDTSLAVLALNEVSRDVSKEVDYLKSQKNDQNCWPKQGCNVKDTSFAVLALNSVGQDLDDEQKWLEEAQSAAPLTGIWYLEIATVESGECKVSYELNNQSVEKSIKVVRGAFPECGNMTFFNINNCLAKGITSSKPSLELDVNCDALPSIESITILYQAGNSFYLVDEDQASRAKLIVKNGCFGKTSKSACDYESSLYANFALKTLQNPMDTLFYLKQGYDAGNPLHNAILFITTADASYSKELSNRQRNDGSWNENVYQTAFADLALKNSEYIDNIESSKGYLEKKQLADHSLGNVQDTAIALYAVYSDAGNLPECFDMETMLCSKQAGSCQGSYEVCSNNTFLSCTDDIYTSFNSTYESQETKCDGLDNDCDGNADTGCDCSAGIKRPCGLQYGVCNGTVETCNADGKWPGCDYSKFPGYEELEKTCNDDKDNDCDSAADAADDDCFNGGSGICDEDGECEFYRGEDSINCPVDCEGDTCSNGIKDSGEDGIDCGGICETSCQTPTDVLCNEDGICEKDMENAKDCPNDCACSDGVCDSFEEEDGSCPDDCEQLPSDEPICGDGQCDTAETKESCPEDCSSGKPTTTGSGKIIWYILLILVLFGMVGYIIYKKKYKKSGKEKTNSFGFKKEDNSKQPIFHSLFGAKKEEKSSQLKTFANMGAEKKTSIEKELDQSISEAKKLLGKEK